MSTPLHFRQGDDPMRSIERTPVVDVMRHGVLSCDPDTPAAEVARMMAEHRIHAVVVERGATDRSDREPIVVGIVSSLDMARAACSPTADLTASDLAATEPVTVETSASLAQAARTMDEHGVAHLVVVDGGRPIGVLSTLDVARALGRRAG